MNGDANRQMGVGRAISFLILMVFLTAPQSLWGVTGPTLNMESPEYLQPLAQKLQKIDPQSFQHIMTVVGLRHPGVPINVFLADEESPLAQQAPGWASGYAVSHRSTIVLLTDRITHYPDDSLEGVLAHEVGHILIHRAAGGGSLPRWFDEGLAMIAARRWDIEDRARLVWAMVTDTRVSLDDLNTLFLQDGASARRGYVLAHAFVKDLMEQTHHNVAKQILKLVNNGFPFEAAFAQATTMTLQQAEENFWSRQTLWNRWVPVATSSGVLWVGITLLAFWAFALRRKRAAAIQKQWEEDEWEI